MGLQRGWFQLENFSGRCHPIAWQGLPGIERSFIISLMHRLLLIGALSIRFWARMRFWNMRDK